VNTKSIVKTQKYVESDGKGTFRNFSLNSIGAEIPSMKIRAKQIVESLST